MPEINGKQVTFREKLPADRWWSLLPRFAELGTFESEFELFERWEFPTVVQVVQAAVESWELDGDPGSAEDVGALDLMDELIPLIQAIMVEFASRSKAAKSGEAESEPTSQ